MFVSVCMEDEHFSEVVFSPCEKGFAFSNKLRPLALSLETLYFLSQASTCSSWNSFCVYNLIKTMMVTVYIIQTIKLLLWGEHNVSVR